MNDETDKWSRDPRILIGEFILADADNDDEKAVAAIKRIAEHVPGAIALTYMARVASTALQARFGDGWRDVLNVSMLATSMEDPDEQN